MSLKSLVAVLAKKKKLINGKKALQKYMYFFDAKGIPNPLTFRIHHYGPYSYELDYQTDYLVLIGAIDLESNGNAFTITPGGEADKLIDSEKDFISRYENLIDAVLESLPKTPLELELWSTTHFIAKSLSKYYGGMSREKVVEEVEKIKRDKFTRNEIADSYDSLIKENFLAIPQFPN
ncbi:MAG TPA: hypothetical protein VFD15_03305 [Clostridia bacterium]|nr:hypothetical protein [Clostridia bacterium]